MEDLRTVLDPHMIKLHVSARNKYDAIKQLAEALLSQRYIKNVDEFVKDIYQRESEGITGIGDGIAIPHGKSNEVEHIGVAIGILSHDIQWETLDERPVNIVILFAVSDDTSAAINQLKLLSLFAGKLGEKRVIDQLHSAKSVDEVISAFTGNTQEDSA